MHCMLMRCLSFRASCGKCETCKSELSKTAAARVRLHTAPQCKTVHVDHDQTQNGESAMNDINSDRFAAGA